MTFHIETRKVQQTGGSSYIISLPKEWIITHGIKEKDTLGIISQADGNLLITPNINSEDKLSSKEFIVDDIKTYNYMFRLLIGAYIMGLSNITIKASRRIEPLIRDCVLDFTKIAIGPEVVEESNNVIIIKDLLNPKEMPFERTIKRMYIIAESMVEESINALRKRDDNVADEVIKRDNELDRLEWLVNRQAHIMLKDIILAQKMGTTLNEANHYYLMARLLERIGDHAERIARNAKVAIGQKVDNEVIEKITAASKISIKLLERSQEAWLKKDIDLANATLEGKKELYPVVAEITTLPKEHSDEMLIAISYIAESVRRIGEYAGDLSEIIINSFIEKSS